MLLRLCCASTSPDRELLSAGFEDGSAKIWRLVPGLFPSVVDTDSPSMIYLSADYLDVEEEEDEADERYLKGMTSAKNEQTHKIENC